MKFNRSQILGLDIDRHIVLDAGAGTGKTTVMAERYVQHLLSSIQRSTLVLPNATMDTNSLSKNLVLPKSQRSKLEAWNGLLPTETVAITFTRKSAGELKHRIRKKLTNLKADPDLVVEDSDVYDFRLNSDPSVIDMLISQLDDAPVSTIDAFFSRLVSIHMDLLTDKPTKDQISDERSQILKEHSIYSAWRARNLQDARKMGILNGELFIESRDRLTVALNGQLNAEKVLIGLMKSSLFVEEAKKSLSSRAQAAGLDWLTGENLPREVLVEMFTKPISGLVGPIINKILPLLRGYLDAYLDQYKYFIQPTIGEHHNYSRFNQFESFYNNVPDSEFAQIQWLFAVLRTGLSDSAVKNGEVEKFLTTFGHDSLNKKWHSGVLKQGDASKSMPHGTKSNAKKTTAKAKTERLEMLKLINTRECRLIFRIGQAALNFIPLIQFDYMPEDFEDRVGVVNNPPQREPPQTKNNRLETDLQIQVITDLFTVFRGCQDVFSDLKQMEGVHDFDDTMRYAEDLLLAKCPSSVRDEWPESVVNALDDLPEYSWSDSHIAKAMQIAKKHPSVYEDLVNRFHILQKLRRQYRAFIIDEFQDTNPAQFRLLTRLWGKRERAGDEGESVLGYWDPTICVVGDMKQSIYRFRQAEVTVMKKATEYIKQANNLELTEKRMDGVLKEGQARDPRFQKEGSFTRATKLHDFRIHGPEEEYNSVGLKDGDSYLPVDDKIREQRAFGHIDLTSNFRTRHDLMNTFNHLFSDVFNPRHHKFPGDWHATAQELNPSSNDTDNGVFEWIMPISNPQGEEKSLDDQIDVFSSSTSNPKDLEAEMIALRIKSLLNKSNKKVWSKETKSMVDIGPDDEEITPDDIMILLHSRGRAPSIINALQKYKIPTQVDQHGLLLDQEVVKPLISVLELLANPNSKHAQASIALSPILNCNEQQVHSTMSSKFWADGWNSMIKFCKTDRNKQLIHELGAYTAMGANFEVFESVLDNSDLLFVYHEPHHRQHAEAFLSLIKMIGNECGDEVAVIYSRIRELLRLEGAGPKASSSNISGAVKLMTIHKSKGLESKVVIVSGIFSAGAQDASMTGGSAVLVTPQLISCRVNPWRSKKTPGHGLYELTSAMEKAQKRAERRREFYVALTRVKSHLIVCGVKSNKSKDDGYSKYDLKASHDSMAHFLTEGLRGSAWRSDVQDSCWSFASDLKANELANADKSWSAKELDPYSVYLDSGLPDGCVKSIAIYHSPDCFEKEESESLTQSIEKMHNNFDKLKKNKSNVDIGFKEVTHKFRVTAHGLDTSYKCKRRHWLTRVRGWDPEKFDPPRLSTSPAIAVESLPSPTKFGLIAHRLVEIGLANPAKQVSKCSLDESWLIKNENGLQNSEIADRVMIELGLGDLEVDGTSYDLTKSRLLEIGELISKGPLGKLSNGGEFGGYTVEGLRTELPFFHSEKIMLDGLSRYYDLNQKFKVSEVKNIFAYFDGRIDLVLALSDNSNDGYLQVVDLKTKDCLKNFNSAEPHKGAPLQKFKDLYSLYPETSAEKALMDDYRLQLALYSVILEGSEMSKPEDERRVVLPPAISVGASGKMIRLTDADYEKAKSDLYSLLEYMAALSATPRLIEEPERITDIEICKKCPFFSGKIKLCGPKSVSLFSADN